MCRRFTLTTKDMNEVERVFDLRVSSEMRGYYQPRYNIAPGDVHWIVRGAPERQVELTPAKWGIRSQGLGLLVNVNSEALGRNATMNSQQRFLERRCIVLADGFFEWDNENDGPVWFHSPDRGLLLFAGIYDEDNRPEETGPALRFGVVTTAANAIVQPIADRMPSILAPA